MARLLDVGCGDGTHAVAQNWPQHYEYRGIDIDQGCVQAARERGLEVSQQDVTEGIDVADDFFDRVIAKAVLEHVDEPLAAARECRRVCKPTGRFEVIVPSDRSFDVWGDYSHRRAFRRDALQNLLGDAGFEVLDIHGRMEWASLGMAIKSVARMAAPWTPYGYPRAWHATARPQEGTR